MANALERQQASSSATEELSEEEQELQALGRYAVDVALRLQRYELISTQM
jgi:hypothetical protein